MTHNELIEIRSNNQAPKLPSLTSIKIAQADSVRSAVEEFIANGGSYSVIDGGVTCEVAKNAKEQSVANYERDVASGKSMDKPIKPKKKNFGLVKP